MRLLASTDFALRVLMRLGQQEPGEHVNVETLAQQLGGLSRNHLHKIVQDLAGLGVLRTVRGAGGGVMLAVPLAEIRLGALIRTLEANQALVECFRADGGCCVLEPACELRVLLRQARESFYQTLEGRTLADCIGHRRRAPPGVSARGRAPQIKGARRPNKP